MIEKGLWPLFFIPGTAGFDTLRTQASIRSATQPARIHRGLSGPAVTECIKGHNTITAGFDTLRYSAC
jgi:3-deoxy-D-arabino-heptulosonate 7-phosphate (DAHP) synthase class II